MRRAPRTLLPPALLGLCALAAGACGNPIADDDTFGRDVPDPGVRGTICSPNGNTPILAALVSAFADDDEDGAADSDTPSGTAVTDATGTYFIEGLVTGTYVAEVRKGHLRHRFPFAYTGGVQQRLDEQCFAPDSSRVVVIEGTCDQPETLLQELGWEPRVLPSSTTEWSELLTNVNALNAEEVLIAPCGMPNSWLPQRQTVTEVVSLWLEGGGSIYISGDAFPLIEALAPDALDFVGDDEDSSAPNRGFGATVQAQVLDASLSPLFGKEPVEVLFAEDGWSMVESAAEATTLLAGDVQTLQAVFMESAPLLAKVETAAGGSIVYSTFGSTADATEDMNAALTEVLLSL